MDFLEITGPLCHGTKIFFKKKKIKKEAQERLMGDVGGTGHYNGTPPSNYCPSVARFRFISENYMCEKCENRFENETEVMIHIRNVHYKDVRKMFASDAIEHLEADQEYHMQSLMSRRIKI